MCSARRLRPIFDELHRSHGVHLRYRTTAVGLIGGNGAATGVMLSDGTRIDADRIIVGVGAVPRTELAAEAGLKIDNGIAVDEHLRTSDPEIFAAGMNINIWDVAEDIERLILSARPINADGLADPAIPLPDFL
jgi:NADPH-dependent 2,4-dienoyl-CoA reductase/sulfur reductase-like enzyme